MSDHFDLVVSFDLKVPGTTAFFSRPSGAAWWPIRPTWRASRPVSGRSPSSCWISPRSAEPSECTSSRTALGNRGLLRALQRIAATVESRGKLKFGQVFLAAPDVDRDLFLDLARLYPEHAEHTTLYASDADLAVHLSSNLHDAPRAGYFHPFTVAPGIDTVAVPNFDVTCSHGYVQAKALCTISTT